MKKVFPFSAIIGQDDLKLALILNVIDPLISGVLISGEKGTAKSTAIRALANLLPKYKSKTCPCNCDPDEPSSWCSFCKDGKFDEIVLKQMSVVELPLGTTEDNLVGGLDIKKALQNGVKEYEAGILAFANRNFLYVDEINLLEDYLVNLLLDVCAMGVATVERDSISFSHPSKFVLIGSMNPEEGDLRPQLLDRFGLFVEVKSVKDEKIRLDILKKILAFDLDSDKFLKENEENQNKLRQKIINAKNILNKVTLSENLLSYIVKICANLSLDGHRGDIVLARTAKAYAAFNGRIEVKKNDIRKVAPFVLIHRQKRLPFEEEKEAKEKLLKALEL
ncbi:ATP-binding protein [Campylobacter sputorum]|uniref:ATP-binding protein n=1 Tax=Campylobacter sputorum TaxID=206 RepID=UPI00053BDCFE|nr:AAA family ATPase [Campylobacter sputorum]